MVWYDDDISYAYGMMMYGMLYGMMICEAWHEAWHMRNRRERDK